MLFASFLYIYICVWIEIDQILRPIRKLKDKEDHSRSSVSRVLVVRIESRSRALIATSYRDIFSKANPPVGKIFGKNDGIYHEGGSQCEQWCVPSGGCIRSRSQKSFVLRAVIGRCCGPTRTRRSRGSRSFFPGTILAELFHSLAWVIVIERFPSLLEIFPYACHRTLSQMARIN